jgi:hypothetical protein
MMQKSKKVLIEVAHRGSFCRATSRGTARRRTDSTLSGTARGIMRTVNEASRL